MTYPHRAAELLGRFGEGAMLNLVTLSVVSGVA